MNRLSVWQSATLIMLLSLWGFAGCGKDARLTDKAIPEKVEVQTVEDAGVLLDKQAEPAKVAYVLLRAIHDDYKAGKDQEKRKAALARQFQVCAPDTIFSPYKRIFPANYPLDRNESIYKIVSTWAPVLGRFSGSFDFDWQTAKKQLIQDSIRKKGGTETTRVMLNVTAPNDAPGSDGESIIVRVSLIREKGYWRVSNVGFFPAARKLAIPKTVDRESPDETPGTKELPQ